MPATAPMHGAHGGGDQRDGERRRRSRRRARCSGARSAAISSMTASSGQHEQEADRDRERQPQRGDQRRQDGVEDRDDRRHDDRAAEAADVGAGDDPGGDQQRERRDEPRDDQPQRVQRAGRAPGSRRAPSVGHRAQRMRRARIMNPARCRRRRAAAPTTPREHDQRVDLLDEAGPSVQKARARSRGSRRSGPRTRAGSRAAPWTARIIHIAPTSRKGSRACRRARRTCSPGSRSTPPRDQQQHAEDRPQPAQVSRRARDHELLDAGGDEHQAQGSPTRS